MGKSQRGQFPQSFIVHGVWSRCNGRPGLCKQRIGLSQRETLQVRRQQGSGRYRDGAAYTCHGNLVNHTIVTKHKLQRNAVTTKWIFTLALMRGRIDRAVVAWKLTVLNDYLCIALQALISHVGDPHWRGLPARSADN